VFNKRITNYAKRKNLSNEVTVQHPHLTSPIEGEETFFPLPWWEGLGEGGELIPNESRHAMRKWFVGMLLVLLPCGCAETPHEDNDQEMQIYEIKKDHPLGWIREQYICLTDKQINEIAQYGIEISTNEKTIVYYSLVRRRGRGGIGKAFVVKGEGDHGHFELVVDIGSGRIQEIHIVKNPVDCTGDSVINRDFIEQFIDKDLTFSFEIVKESEDVMTTPTKIKQIKMAPITSEKIAKELRKWLVIVRVLKLN